MIEEGPEKQVRMANLAIVGSHAVNGVSQLHSELIKSALVPDFAQLWPETLQQQDQRSGAAPLDTESQSRPGRIAHSHRGRRMDY